MGLCETCKYWEKPNNEYGEVPGTGKCKAVVQFWDATECVDNDEYDTRKLKPEHAKKLAFVRDGSDYYAELKTMHNFGCVQYERI